MMLKVKAFLITCLLILTGHAATAQQRDTVTGQVISKLNYYGIKKSNTLMFVHIDKTVYVNNEVMWFTAYILGGGVADVAKHQVLSVSIVNNNDQTITVQQKFVMSAGLAFGNVAIPDSIPPGNYSFVACTNVMRNGKPEAVFVQPFTLKSATQPAFDVELTLDTTQKQAPAVHAMLNVRAKSSPLEGAVVNYYLGKDAHTRIAGKTKTNILGMYDVLIPKDHITPAQHNLEVQVRYAGETKTLHLNLPIDKQVWDVKFYPEGGHLVNDMFSRVGWEVKSPGGVAIKTQGVLYANDKIVDTIETDSYGMGSFYVVPEQNTAYKVKLLQGPTDAAYTLPAVLTTGVAIRLPEALAADTLKLQLRSNYTGKLILLVHNYKRVFSSMILRVASNGGIIKIDLSGVPRGLNTITVLDSLQRPCAERLFFAHYDQKPHVSISTGKTEYGARQKVTLKLKLNGLQGKPAIGIVSVACVQDNRFEVKNDNNIEHYFYLQSQLDNLPLKEDLLGTTEVDRNYLNELLLVRGWSKYRWPELINASAADTVKKYDNALFSGIVTRYGSRLKKPVSLLLMRGSTSKMIMFNSDDNGNFKVTNEDVVTQQNKKARLIVNGKSVEYTIKIADPYLILNKTIARTVEPLIYEDPITQNTAAFTLTGFEHATHLKEVIIRASLDGYISSQHANECGDYVCMYHILNCPNHPNSPNNVPAIKGKTYYVPGMGPQLYTGCNMTFDRPGMLSFTGIYQPKDFYGSDYTVFNPTEPDYQSTIYWKHSIRINSDTDTEISFYTSDITGKYRIVVQGLTNQDVVYGEGAFTVKKNTP